MVRKQNLKLVSRCIATHRKTWVTSLCANLCENSIFIMSLQNRTNIARYIVVICSTKLRQFELATFAPICEKFVRNLQDRLHQHVYIINKTRKQVNTVHVYR